MSKANIEEQLHRNYIRLAKIVHPDLNPNNPDADRAFQTLQEQYEKAQRLIGANTQYQAVISISLKEAVEGTDRYFSADNNQKFVLHIPAGVKHRQTVLFRQLSVDFKKDVVLHIKVLINLPPKFSIVGNQLILKETVTFWRLHFGGPISIMGADEKKINLVLPKKTKNGKMFKINGAGLLDRESNKRQPLYIQFFGCVI